jgi:predicted permease
MVQGLLSSERQSSTPEEIRTMRQDITYAVRLFCRHPVLFGVSLLGLTIGIGIAAAAWSITSAVAFAPSDVRAPESVVRVGLAGRVISPVTGDSPVQGNWAYLDYVQLSKAVHTLDLVAAASYTASFSIDGRTAGTESVRVTAVSGRYFPVLGFQAVIGRTLFQADERSGVLPLLLSRGFWKRRFNADPAIVGRTMWLDDRAYTVVGVADRANLGSGIDDVPPAFWTTLSARAAPWTAPTRWNPAVSVFGRLGNGRSRAQAATEVATITAALTRVSGARETPPTVRLESLDVDRSESMMVAAGLMTVVILLVVLACANTTNVLLATAAVRRHEIATRLAMGAGRGRVLRQIFTESILLAAVAAALAFVVAHPLTPALAALVQVPPTYDVSPARSAVVFVALVGLAAGILAGVQPARYGWRRELASVLRSEHSPSANARPHRRFASSLIGGQAAISVVLLGAAALLTRAALRNAETTPGYDVNALVNVTIGVDPGNAMLTTHLDQAFWGAALDGIRGLRGVESAALTLITPFGNGSASQMFGGRRVHRNETSSDYFETVGLRVIRGRTYSPAEVGAGAAVAVISASLAREVWNGADPIGSTLAPVWGPDTPATAAISGLMRRPVAARVIGVVADAQMHLADGAASTIYLPLADPAAARVVVRARHPQALLSPIRDVVERLEPELRVSTLLVADGWRNELERPRILASLATVLGAIALGLAAVGLFGVNYFAVEQRLHEMGVRRALGASRITLTRMLLWESLSPVVVGSTSGVALFLASAPLMQGALYGFNPHDPTAIAASVVIILVTSTAAVLAPVQRAVTVNPAILLRLT